MESLSNFVSDQLKDPILRVQSLDDLDSTLDVSIVNAYTKKFRSVDLLA